MPLLSERQALLKQLDTVLKYLMLDGKEESEDFKELYELKGSISRTRLLILEFILKRIVLCMICCGEYLIETLSNG